MQLKKIYVLAALLIEKHHALLRGNKSRVDSYLQQDDQLNDLSVIDKAWKGAEAYHFFLLAQKQLYDGYVDAAMSTGNLLNFLDL